MENKFEKELNSAETERKCQNCGTPLPEENFLDNEDTPGHFVRMFTCSKCGEVTQVPEERLTEKEKAA